MMSGDHRVSTTVASILLADAGSFLRRTLSQADLAAVPREPLGYPVCCDFISVANLGAFSTIRFMVFFVMELKSRAVHISGVNIDLGGAWMMQVARNLLDPVDGFLHHGPTRFMIGTCCSRRPGPSSSSLAA